MDDNLLSEYYSVIKNKIDHISFNSALGNIDKLLSNYPNEAGGYYYQGVCKFALEKYDEAITSYKKAIMLDITYAKAYFNIGVAFYLENDYDQALINIAKALVLFTKKGEFDCRERCLEALNFIQIERKTYN